MRDSCSRHRNIHRVIPANAGIHAQCLLVLGRKVKAFRNNVRIVELCAGTAAETVLHTDDAPWIAHSDLRQARSLASIICSSAHGVDAYLLFVLAEATALIDTHRHVVLALAHALMVERTLDAERIDSIIAAAVAVKSIKDERQRRLDWQLVIDSAARFALAVRTGT